MSKWADDPAVRRERALRAGAAHWHARSSPGYHLKQVVEAVPPDVAKWAEEVAAGLPPLTRQEVAAVARIAAAMATRAAESEGGGSNAA